jgi:hypothetical protein
LFRAAVRSVVAGIVDQELVNDVNINLLKLFLDE